ncbi:hypothetical protein NOR_03424 [Metarhizium rileyi]|uniref:Uncharacterized protein n=1 Tax=Metarhizium rileyi (strain RCEF 4871) TaxID=1649241 RepID=A0A167FR41_METRR|nr:hypothetical protein NOR_03424 [Metarhizium rileyi RCEF 4871]
MPSPTLQPQPQLQLQSQTQQQQLRHMKSFTQRFRSRKPASRTVETATTATCAPLESAPHAQQPRQRSPYVPTHAAASFARTVLPLSRTRIDEGDELLDVPQHAYGCDEATSYAGTSPMHSTCIPRGRHVCTSSSSSPTDSHFTTAPSNGSDACGLPAASHHQALPRKSGFDGSPADLDDYATFLAEAEANDLAFRSRWAQRKKERERQWASSKLASLPQSVKGTQRDSAYYSMGSVSRSSMSRGGPQKQQTVHDRPSAPAPGSGSVPASPPTLHHKPSRTLGRRISEYFKPSPEERGATAV